MGIERLHLSPCKKARMLREVMKKLTSRLVRARMMKRSVEMSREFTDCTFSTTI